MDASAGGQQVGGGRCQLGPGVLAVQQRHVQQPVDDRRLQTIQAQLERTQVKHQLKYSAKELSCGFHLTRF